jgi:hypothetical protein
MFLEMTAFKKQGSWDKMMPPDQKSVEELTHLSTNIGLIIDRPHPAGREAPPPARTTAGRTGAPASGHLAALRLRPDALPQFRQHSGRENRVQGPIL